STTGTAGGQASPGSTTKTTETHMGITRRRFNALMGSSLALPAATAWSAAQDDAYLNELYEAAKKEGELTWYVAHFDSETAQAVGQGFTERYPGVNVNVVRTTAQVAFQRLNQDIRAGTPNCD